MLAPDVLFIGPKGFITEIKEWLDVHRSGEYKQILLEANEKNIRAYYDRAIVNEIKNSECEYKSEIIKGNSA